MYKIIYIERVINPPSIKNNWRPHFFLTPPNHGAYGCVSFCV